MALIVNEQSSFKHFCKICKKGFGCGRALGGHMRAHGIGDENGHVDDEDQESDWDEKYVGDAPPCNKRMYALRTNPNRLKNCRICENCGKEFLSWKSFLEHGKCTYDAESLVSSPGSDNEADARQRWFKRKRSYRSKVGNFYSNCPSSEEEDLANCLMMLSNATVDPLEVEPEESCASASKDEERRNPINYISPISFRVPIDKAKGVATKGTFECKACKKVFNSHQALGGHRASHKKVKGCFAARLDHHHHMDDNLVDDDVITQEEFLPSKAFRFDHGSNPSLLYASKRKSKVHECSICHRIFSSGQALGGHKRCHWITSNSTDTSSIAKFHLFQDQMEQVHHRPKFNDSEPLDLKLDLNFPAPTDDLAGVRQDTLNPFEVSTEIFLHYNQINNENNNKNNNDSNNVDNKNDDVLMENGEDEADSKIKLAKLSDLKDTNMSESSSSWLQVGIGST